jgi:hypothetical protein
MPSLRKLRAVLFGAGLASIACAPSSSVQVALYGDLPALRREIERAGKAGELDARAVEELSHAVARRELSSASGEAGARRVRQLRPCALPLSDALGERAERADEAAAEALLALLVQRKVEGEPLVDEYQHAEDGAFRMVAARAALARKDVLRRRAWFLDPDQRVRRAAFEAALERPYPGDAAPALEALRLDPDPLVQSLAARLVGTIGGDENVLGLRDRFERADPTSRLAIVDAWSLPASFDAGGERELRRVLERAQDTASVAAARALLARGRSDAAVLGVLEQAIRNGSDSDRRLAIAAAPVGDPRLVEALVAASKDADRAIGALAHERLASLPKHRELAFGELRALAKQRTEAGEEARAALARLGDRSVVPELVTDVAKAEPWRRTAAALELYDLGAPAAAARALADPDPGVRTTVACGVLSRKKRG